jgi:serine/threonine-protein kinase
MALHALDLRDGSTRLVQQGATRGLYAGTGHVLFVRPDGALFAVRFDADRLEPQGAPVPVQDSVSIVDGSIPLLALSAEGTLLHRVGATGSLLARFQLVWVDRNGSESPVDTAWSFRHVVFGGNAGWALSPDGSRVAIGLSTPAGDNLWVKRLPAGPAVRVTFDSGAEFRPRWLADGRSLLFSSNRATPGLYRRPADGTGEDELVLPGQIFEGQLSRDGQWLLARAGGQVNQVGGRDIGALRIGVDTALAPLVATPFDESEIALSPDGRWLAYVSDETGRPEVFIRPFPDVGSAKHQVSTTGGASPLWSHDGRELFFLDAGRVMRVAAVSPGAALRMGEPRALFRLGEDIYPQGREYYTPYDLSPDGRRFLMARRVRTAEAPEAPLLVTLNWFEELSRRQYSR